MRPMPDSTVFPVLPASEGLQNVTVNKETAVGTTLRNGEKNYKKQAQLPMKSHHSYQVKM